MGVLTLQPHLATSPGPFIWLSSPASITCVPSPLSLPYFPSTLSPVPKAITPLLSQLFLSSCHSLHLPLPPVSLSHSSQISPFMFNPQPLSVSFVPLHLISSCPLFRILFASRVVCSHPGSLNGPQGFWAPWGGGQPVDLRAGKRCGASRHLRRVGMDGPEVGRAC